MNREEFIRILDEKGYSYEIEGDKIVVTHRGGVDLGSLTSLPPGVEFKNWGGVGLDSLTSLPPGVEFMNGGSVRLESLTIIHPGLEFKNGGSVRLDSIKAIPPGVVFENEGSVYLESLIWGEGWFEDWSGNIEGIDNKRLLNHMISKGMFI